MSEKPVVHFNAVDSDIFQSNKDIADFEKALKEAKAKVVAETVKPQRTVPSEQ